MYWRLNFSKINHVFESFIIVLHDFLVLSPSYFVFEMECIRCVIRAKNLDHFKKIRRSLVKKSAIIASILVTFSLVAAFLNAFTQDDL
jgi:hypothetical protein